MGSKGHKKGANAAPKTAPATGKIKNTKAWAERRKRNLSAPVSRLTNELVSEVLLHGLYDRENWMSPSQYLRYVGSVLSQWLRVRDNTATLWTKVTYESKKTKKENDNSLALFDLFLTRSKGEPLDIFLNLLYMSEDSQQANSYLTRLLPNIVRCRYLNVAGYQKDVVASLFPLPRDARALQIVKMELLYQGPCAPWSLFEEGHEAQLKTLSFELDPRAGPIADCLKNVDPSHITYLSSGCEMDPALLQFASRCSSLEALRTGGLCKAFGSIHDSDYRDIPVARFPNLNTLSIGSHIPFEFLYIMDCPKLVHLHFDPSEDALPPLAFPRERLPDPNLRTLMMEELPLWAMPEMVRFLRTSSSLKAIETPAYTRLHVLFRNLLSDSEFDNGGEKEDGSDDGNSDSDDSDEDDGEKDVQDSDRHDMDKSDIKTNIDQIEEDVNNDISIPCSNLELIRLRGESYFMDDMDKVFKVFKKLLRQRPNLKVEWVGGGPSDELEEMEELFPGRMSYIWSVFGLLSGSTPDGVIPIMDLYAPS